MLQKAYEQAKSQLTKLCEIPVGRRKEIIDSLPVEVRNAYWKIFFELNVEELKKLIDGSLTVDDLVRFQAPDCSIK